MKNGGQRMTTAAIALATGVLGFALGQRSTRPTPGRAGDGIESPRSQPPTAVATPAPAAVPGATAAPAAPSTDDARATDVPARTTNPASSSARAPSPSSGAAAPARAGRRRVVLGEVDLTDIGYDRGDPAAPIVLVDFSDFACPYCGTFARETFPAIERDYVRTGKVYLKYVPFLAGFPRGREATRAAECAAEQGKFWEMADALYADQNAWKRAGEPLVVLQGLARSLGADSARFRSCYVTNQPDDRTRRATRAADELRVRVTPSFVLNGRPIEGAVPLAELRKLLDLALLVEESKR